MKKTFQMLLILVLAAACVNIRQTERTLEKLEHGVIRLHILANSDTLADQTEKLLVRDAVLESAQAQMPQTADRAEMLDALQNMLPELQSIAEQTLRDAGSEQPVSLSLCETAFPARSYGAVTLPAGNYQTLRIVIGEGAGQNWWCVMYPGLCLPAASEETVIAESFDENVTDLTVNPEKYEIRLKCVELWRSIVQWVKEQTNSL